MRTRSLTSIALALALPFGAQLAAAAAPNAPAAPQVAIRNFHFVPARLVVPAGATVTWTNRDEEPHLVASAGAKFRNSPPLDTGDHYSATFAQPGTYIYFCSIHPQMVGTIVVR